MSAGSENQSQREKHLHDRAFEDFLLRYKGIEQSLLAEGSQIDKADRSDLLLKYLELSVSDFHRSYFASWRRARSAIEHENILINHRITWLIFSQAGLFSAFALLYRAVADKPGEVAVREAIFIPTLLICWLGCAVCGIVFYNISNASIQIGRITKWWYDQKRAEIDTEDKKYLKYIQESVPPLHLWRSVEAKLRKETRIGSVLNFIEPLFRTEALPVYFSLAWLSIFIGVFFPAKVNSILDYINTNPQVIAAVAGIIMFTSYAFFMGTIIGARRSKNSSEQG